ncbi:hypothetical protein [Candidatus Cryosericum odellii]|jgi:hypothetical protein|uniref:DUF5668 domain-containing protein n=1 Tax=Candidatus Cryosericum odellii TaxID=2290917 RepID=A0A398DID7_9BACT|nr:hypothetical protein [Candidatus Cryosericum odellii]RIE10791.1 hypothetical protein SMC6_00840 [Candidatus Cryosericum odellii]RIE15657.1 hypothetical protein SMC5_00750 [Candidatus Cryosericum odellii]
MTEQNTHRTRSSMASVGILLIVAGIVIFALQYVHIDMSWLPNHWAELTWPLRIIIPGLALFVVGLMLPDRAGEGLSGFGLVAAAAGVLLWYQAVTGTWESWAYAWALVLPAAGGIASIIHGMLHANWRHVRDGVGGLAFGLVAFVVLGYVFESWLGYKGFGLNQIAAWVPGGILLAVGVIVLFVGTPGEHSSRRAEREQRHIEREQRGAERRTTPQGWTSAPVVPPEEKKMETITPAEPTKPEDKQPQ